VRRPCQATLIGKPDVKMLALNTPDYLSEVHYH
jgi:hypothetical protein